MKGYERGIVVIISYIKETRKNVKLRKIKRKFGCLASYFKVSEK